MQRRSLLAGSPGFLRTSLWRILLRSKTDDLESKEVSTGMNFACCEVQVAAVTLKMKLKRVKENLCKPLTFLAKV